MNQHKRLIKVDMTFTLQGVDHVYRNYLRGFRWTIATEDEVNKAKEVVAGFEAVLIRSGYLTEGEIQKRRMESGYVDPSSVIATA